MAAPSTTTTRSSPLPAAAPTPTPHDKGAEGTIYLVPTTGCPIPRYHRYRVFILSVVRYRTRNLFPVAGTGRRRRRWRVSVPIDDMRGPGHTQSEKMSMTFKNVSIFLFKIKELLFFSYKKKKMSNKKKKKKVITKQKERF